MWSACMWLTTMASSSSGWWRRTSCETTPGPMSTRRLSAAALDEVAGAASVGFGDAGERPMMVSRIDVRAHTWTRAGAGTSPGGRATRRGSPWPRRMARRPGVLTRATSRRSAQRSSAARTNAVPTPRDGGPGGRSGPRGWHGARHRRAPARHRPAHRRDRGPRATCSPAAMRLQPPRLALGPLGPGVRRVHLVDGEHRSRPGRCSTLGSAPLDRHVVREAARRRPGADARSSSRGPNHLLPLRDPARQAADGEAVREHVLRDADRAVDEPE